MVEVKFKENRIVTLVNLTGVCKTRKNVEAIIDTGFTGYASIPLHIAVDIGMEFMGYGNVMLADGTIIDVPIFAGKIQIGDATYRCPFMILDQESVILGIELIKKFPSLCIYGTEGRVEAKSPRVEETPLGLLYEYLKGLIPP